MRVIAFLIIAAVSSAAICQQITFDPNYCGPISAGKYKTIFKGFVNGLPVTGFISDEAAKDLCPKLKNLKHTPKSAREICNQDGLPKGCVNLNKLRKVK